MAHSRKAPLQALACCLAQPEKFSKSWSRFVIACRTNPQFRGKNPDLLDSTRDFECLVAKKKRETKTSCSFDE